MTADAVATPGASPREAITAQEVVRCDHCTLPVPKGLVNPEADQQFCCGACELAYSTIHACGLDAYYRIRERTGIGSDARAASSTSGDAFSEFDDPAFQAIHCRTAPDGAMTTDFVLEGVHCAACVWLIEKLPRVAPGVILSRVNLATSSVRIAWNPDQLPLAQIARALDSLGYRPHPARQTEARNLRRIEDRKALIRIAVAGACAGNVMLVSIALYGGLFTSIEPIYFTTFRWASAVIGLLCVLWPGAIFFRGALASIRARAWSLDTPIAVALGAGALAGLVNTASGAGEIYFDSITMLVFLLLVGRWLQSRSQRSALDAVEMLFSLTPSRARRLATDMSGAEVIQEVSVESLQPGDVVEVRAGDAAPVDGVVVQGESDVETALLTGEPNPVAVRPGDCVSAGSTNTTAPIRLRAEAVGAETRIGRVMSMVQQFASEKGHIAGLIDRHAGKFVAAVLALAALTLVIWLPSDPSGAVQHAIALLIITCPCALALATPLVTTVAIGKAARRGILIKGAGALDVLATSARAAPNIILDKTGTITEGAFRVVAWTGDESAAASVAAIERTISHPIASALASHADPDLSMDVRYTKVHPSAGVEADVDGRRFLIGSREFIESATSLPSLTPALQSNLDTTTQIHIAVDGTPIAIAHLGDQPRDGAGAAIRELHNLGWRASIASGDRAEAARAIAAAVGIDPDNAFAPMSPEEKAALIRELKPAPVAMVGDGVNDAPALALADVGIAVKGGAEASLIAADVYIARPGLDPLVELILGARRCRVVIKRALIASLSYNAVAASLAVAGLVSPLLGAILMPASSITVLLVAIRSRTFS